MAGKLEELLIGCVIIVVTGVIGITLCVTLARAPWGASM